jgi:hypothetical protein
VATVVPLKEKRKKREKRLSRGRRVGGGKGGKRRKEGEGRERGGRRVGGRREERVWVLCSSPGETAASDKNGGDGWSNRKQERRREP